MAAHPTPEVADARHPRWCDLSECTAVDGGTHHSTAVPVNPGGGELTGLIVWLQLFAGRPQDETQMVIEATARELRSAGHHAGASGELHGHGAHAGAGGDAQPYLLDLVQAAVLRDEIGGLLGKAGGRW